ncbi:MAG: NAD-dependent malic enzyme [Gammaproteobacteria bacterium]|nr:NAD-dependent malic enzyme [Gammaproteobacteria bacterium]
MDSTPRIIRRSGHDLIRDPLLNKGSAFTLAERRAFHLDGLLPHRPVSIDIQRARVFANLDRLQDPLDKYMALAALQDRNEHLYFNVLVHRLEEYLPVIYTPTVGLATQRYSHVFQRARGVWITPGHKGRIADVLRQAAAGRNVRLIVATDNESILGIGDQGAGGMAISIGKLALYTAAAGVDPAFVLPVSLDVGTGNAQLLADPHYLGWPAQRLRGAAYDELLDEFVAAVASVFPGALVQWEDFRKENALRVLDRYRNRLPTFNDDIQGTGAVALAGLLAAGRITGRRISAERVLVLGAGAAGLGIIRQLRSAMQADGAQGVPLVAALDSRGLIVDDEPQDAYKRELAWPAAVAAGFGLVRGHRTLQDVVERFHPTVLIGTSGQANAFSESVVRAMTKHCERPVILPLSNPTAHCEARPQDLYDWTAGRALVATGSPFGPVQHGGRQYRVGQGNNAFIFPAVGLAALAAGLVHIGDQRFSAAARALSQALSEAELAEGLLYPSIARLREVSRQVARAVLAAGDADGPGPEEMEAGRRMAAMWWEPEYVDYRPA